MIIHYTWLYVQEEAPIVLLFIFILYLIFWNIYLDKRDAKFFNHNCLNLFQLTYILIWKIFLENIRIRCHLQLHLGPGARDDCWKWGWLLCCSIFHTWPRQAKSGMSSWWWPGLLITRCLVTEHCTLENLQRPGRHVFYRSKNKQFSGGFGPLCPHLQTRILPITYLPLTEISWNHQDYQKRNL